MHRLRGACLVCCACCAVTEEVTADEGRRVEAESSFVSTQLVIVKPQAQRETDKSVEVHSCFLFSGAMLLSPSNVELNCLFHPHTCINFYYRTIDQHKVCVIRDAVGFKSGVFRYENIYT